MVEECCRLCDMSTCLARCPPQITPQYFIQDFLPTCLSYSWCSQFTHTPSMSNHVRCFLSTKWNLTVACRNDTRQTTTTTAHLQLRLPVYVPAVYYTKCFISQVLTLQVSLWLGRRHFLSPSPDWHRPYFIAKRIIL